MDINSRNLGQQEEDLDKKKFRKRASMSRPTTHAVDFSLRYIKYLFIECVLCTVVYVYSSQFPCQLLIQPLD